MNKFFTHFILLILLTTSTNAQLLHLYDVDIEAYPIINAKFYAIDENDKQITGLGKDDIIINEGFEQRPIMDLSCPPPNQSNEISTLLVIDISASMVGERIGWVRDAARYWAQEMDSLKEEAAIIGFSDEAVLYSDYRMNRFLLYEAIDEIETFGGTNYSNAFLTPKYGVIPMLRKAQYTPIVVFLTDGLGSDDFDKDSIIQAASEYGAIIYTISVGIKMPNSLKEISLRTGGQYFENANTREDIDRIYKLIRNFALNLQSCEITWMSEGCVIGRKGLIEIPKYNLTNEFDYQAPGPDLPEFEISDEQFLIFNCNRNQDRLITFTARKQDIEVFNVFKTGTGTNCRNFEIELLDRSTPFTLAKDESFQIRVTQNPQVAEFSFCEFTIDASSCLNNNFYAISNCLSSSPSISSIDILYPNGGEVLFAESNENVLWRRSLPESYLEVDYSTDAGNSWYEINSGDLGLSTNWKLPLVSSDECLVRVRQFSDAIGEKINSINADSTSVFDLDWNPNGNNIAAVCSDSTIKVYNPIMGFKLYQLQRLSGYDEIRKAKWAPDGVRLLVIEGNKLVIWNTLNKTYSEFSSFNNAKEIDWSNDGKFIAVCGDNLAKIYDAIDGTEIIQIQESKNISSIKFSNNSQFFAYGTNKETEYDVIKIRRAEELWTDNKIIILSAQENSNDLTSIESIDWSSDNSKLLVSTKDRLANSIEIWDFFSKTLVHKNINEHSALINDIAFNPRNNLIASVDNGFKVSIGEYNDQLKEYKSVYNFVSSKSNNAVSWSPDGSRIIVGSSGLKTEDLLNLYAVEIFPLIEATSDSLFSIITERLQCSSIDMGQSRINDTKEITITNWIEFNSEYKIRIDSILIQNDGDGKYFDLTSQETFPIKFNSQSQIEFLFSFTPREIRIYQAKIYIYSQFGKDSCLITGEGVQPEIEVNSIDFGEVLVDEVEYSDKFAIKNSGTGDLTVSRISIIGPHKTQFSLIDNNNEVDFIENIIIRTSDIHNISIKFEPKEAELFSGILKIEFINSDFQKDSIFPLILGEGIAPILSVDSPLKFNDLECFEKDTQNLVIRNLGKGVLTLNKDILISPDDFELVNRIDEDIRINQNDSILIPIIFSPENEGVVNGILNLNSNSIENLQTDVILTGQKRRNSFIVDNEFPFVFNGLDYNQPHLFIAKIINNGQTDLFWDIPLSFDGGKSIISNVDKNPTLPGDTATFTIEFTGGKRGEFFEYRFAPMPDCSDSINLGFYLKDIDARIQAYFQETYQVVCEDTLDISIPISNIGEENLIINNITLSNNNAFSIKKMPREEIAESDSDNLIISFSSTISESYSLNIFINSNAINSNDENNYLISFDVNKFESSFEIEPNEIEFIYIGTNRPSPQFIEVQNTGTYAINWNTFNFNNPNFEIISISPMITEPNESSVFEISYIGPDEKLITETLMITDSCGNTKELIANVLPADIAGADILISEERRKIGEEFDLNFEIKNSNRLEQASISGFRGTIEFNHSLMVNMEGEGRIVGDKREVDFEFNKINDGELGKIRMKALWGNDSCTEIKIKNIEAIGNGVSTHFIKKFESNLCIIDLCHEGGTRLLNQATREDEVIKIYPQPVSDILIAELSLLEKGANIVNIISLDGQKLFSKEFYTTESGKYQIEIQLRGIIPGLYILETKTPTEVFHKKLIIN